MWVEGGIGGIFRRGALPMDAVPGAAWEAVYAMAPVTKSWWHGMPLFDIVISGATYTIKSVKGGVDIRRLAALLQVSPRFGIAGGLCPKLYDQSGHGRNATQATTANQPAIWLIDGKVYIAFGGILSTNAVGQGAGWLSIPSAPFNNQSLSIYAAVKPYTSGAAVIGQVGQPQLWNTSNYFGGYIGSGEGQPQIVVLDFTTFAGPNLTLTSGHRAVVGYVLGPSASQCSINESSASAVAANIGTGTTTNGVIGWGSGAPWPAGFCGRMQCILISSSVFTTAQQTQIKQALYKWSDIRSGPPATTGLINVCLDGASWTEGQGGDPCGLYGSQNGGGYGWAEMLSDQLDGYAIQWSSFAASGNKITDCTSSYSNNSACFNSSAAKNILIGPGDAVGNSLDSGRTGAQAYSDFQAWLTAVKAQTWNAILVFTFSGTGEQANYNTALLAGAGAGGYTTIVLPPGIPLQSFDGIHPTITGHRLVAATLYPYLQAVL